MTIVRPEDVPAYALEADYMDGSREWRWTDVNGWRHDYTVFKSGSTGRFSYYVDGMPIEDYPGPLEYNGFPIRKVVGFKL